MTGEALGKHDVKIVGYGIDNGTAYWTIANCALSSVGP